MFLATPRLFWNSPNRRRPANASRTISTDQTSPTASSERAIGQASVSKLLRFMADTPHFVGGRKNFSIRLQDATAYSTIPRQLKITNAEPEKVMSKKLAGK